MDELECYGVQGISDQTCCMNWPKYYKATMAELSSFRGPNSFLKWVVSNKFSLEPLFSKHLGIIFGSRDGACFAYMSIQGEETTCECYRNGYVGWTESVKYGIERIPTFTSLYRQA